MSWYVQTVNYGLTVAGPFEDQKEAYAWAIAQYKKCKDTLFHTVQLDILPLEPMITDKMTPALHRLQEIGEVILVSLPFGFLAVYLV